MAASEGPEKLRDLVDARAFRPDLSFCMGSIEATIFMDLSAESASGAVDKVKFLAKLDKHASKLGGGTSKSKATAARKKNAAAAAEGANANNSDAFTHDCVSLFLALSYSLINIIIHYII